MNKEVKFDFDIMGLDETNVREKVLPYVNELIGSLLGNECRDVRIQTKIRKLSDKEASVFMTIDDLKGRK